MKQQYTSHRNIRKMKVFIAAYLMGFVAGTCRGQGILGPNWSRALSTSIDELTKNIQRNVQGYQQSVQDDVGAQIQNLAKEIPKTIAAAGGQTINLMNDGSKQIYISQNGNTPGKSYSINVWVEGNILHHRVSVPNLISGTTNQWLYTLDLADGSSQPILVNPVRKNN